MKSDAMNADAFGKDNNNNHFNFTSCFTKKSETSDKFTKIFKNIYFLNIYFSKRPVPFLS